MEPLAPDLERSVRRSDHRLRVLLLLASMRRAYVGQLARALGVEPRVVRWCLDGRLPYYSPRLALVPQGLAVLVAGARGREYEITTRGMRKARSLTARRRRAVDPLSDLAARSRRRPRRGGSVTRRG